MRFLAIFFTLLFPLTASAAEKIVNIYTWANEIPDTVVRQFEKEMHIKVNLSTYANNEVLYAKLRAAKNSGYDIIVPTSYYVDRMRHQNMLEKLDKTKLSNFKNINLIYLNSDYDPGAQFSVPHVMGITGIFDNNKYYPENSIKKWSDLWDPRFYDQLLLLDDTREVFSIGLLALGYSPNDRDPEHIKAAFLKLKNLMKNVKVFSTETVAAIIIDEDAAVGSAWNGDVFKAARENPSVKFIFPEDGFVIWVDNLCIPKNAPHKDNAYQFINFILRPEMGKQVALTTNFSTANLAAQQLLPAEIRNNPTIYPPKEVLARGQFQTDVGEEALQLYEKYWEELKMSG